MTPKQLLRRFLRIIAWGILVVIAIPVALVSYEAFSNLSTVEVMLAVIIFMLAIKG